jgi:glycosyltransferase involved in cell wall biosynthesis
MKLKVLWLCSRPLSDVDDGATATWLGAMARGLLDSGAVELGIIAPGPVGQFTRRDYGQAKQWIIPGRSRLGRDGLPPASVVQAIAAAGKEFSPSLVHSWGTEGFWALLPARGLLPYPALLEIQGLKGQFAKVFYGGLTLPEQLRCTGIKELLKRRTMHSDRRDFARWGLREEEMIRGHRFVDVQSLWVASQVRAIAPDVRQFPMDRALRQPFYDTDGWQSSGRATVFCTAAYPAPYKGLHVAVRALRLLKMRIPGARLRIAGAHQQPGIRQNGYMRWVNRMIQQLDLVSTVDWLGPLNAEQIVAELKNAAAAVFPTFAETYCVAFAEAMRVGTPAVVSYTGGTAYVGKDEDSCLFFPPGDEAMCAYQLERVLTDKELALRLSRESRKIAMFRNDRQRVVQRQLEIYRQVVEEC